MPEDMGGTAVAEPVESTGATETVETGATAEETGAIAEETSNESGSQAKKSDLTEKTGGKTTLNLADIAKSSKDALAKINPVLPAAIQKAAYELQGLYREFPGGLKEAVALRNEFQQFGGAEGVKEIQQAVSEYGSLEQKFEKGDPAFMTSLADAAPASFSQIMPAGLEKWKAIDAESYNHSMARAIMQTPGMDKLSETIARVHNALDPEKGKEFRAELAQAFNLLDGIRQLSEKAPERKINPQDEALTQREQELAQREIQINLKPIITEGKAQIAGIVDREMMRDYQWDKTDADTKSALIEKVTNQLKALNDKTFNSEFERLKARGDWAGLSRHVKNFQERVLPTMLPKVARLFNVKPKGAPVVTKKTMATNGAAVVEAGWTQIAQMPKASQIDYAATAAEARKQKAGSSAEDLILNNKAILKDKRRVTWP